MKGKKWSRTFVAVALAAGMLSTGTSSFAWQNNAGNRGSMFIERFDTDDDGKVSKEEFLVHFGDLDTNGDGFIDASEAPKGPPRHHGRRCMNLIENFDSDGDGKVSRAEFPGSDRRFKLLDANEDGFIDQNETGRKSPAE